MDSPTTISCVGNKLPKGLPVVAYVCQVIAIFIVILACLVNLSIGDDKAALWSSLLSGSLGYLLPNPKIRNNNNNNKDERLSPNPTVKQFNEIFPKQYDQSLYDTPADSDRARWGTLGVRADRAPVHEVMAHSTEK
jgi:hypothetical protein